MTQTRHTLSPEALLTHSSWLRELALRLVQDEGDADDVVQDTLVAAWRRGPDSAGSGRGWLARVARNFAFRRLRSRELRDRHEPAAAVPEGLLSTAELVEGVSAQQDVARAVLQLNEPYRSTILQRYWESVSPADIARHEGIPVATVKTRLRRGLALLREDLDRRCGGREAWVAALLPMVGGSVTATSKAAGALVLALVFLVAGSVWLTGTDSSSTTNPEYSSRRVGTSSARLGVTVEARRSVIDAPGDRIRPPTSAKRLRTVTGLVVDAISGAPVEGARIVKPRDYDPDFHVEELWAVTDSEGAFRFEARKFFGRKVWVRAPRHASRVAFVKRKATPDEERSTIDFGTIRLERGVEVLGRVVDRSGVPVENARILLSFNSSVDDPHFPLVHSREVGRSGVDGLFRIKERIDRSGYGFLYALSDQGIGWVSGRMLGPGDHQTIEIGLRGIGTPVEVTVRTADGRSAPGMTVHAIPRFSALCESFHAHGGFFGLRPETAALFEGITDEAGNVSFPFLPIDHDIWYNQSRWHGNAYNFAVFRAGSSGPVAWKNSVLLSGARRQSIEIRLPGLRQPILRGTVRTPWGEPLVGAVLSAERSRSRLGVADRLGEFEFKVPDGLRGGGPISVFAKADGFGYSEFTRTLPADGDPERCDFVLHPIQPVAGVVLDESGLPVRNVLVSLLPTSPDQREVSIQPRRTDGDGRFRFEDSAAGAWTLSVKPPQPGWEHENPEQRVLGGDEHVVMLPADELTPRPRQDRGASTAPGTGESAAGCGAAVALCQNTLSPVQEEGRQSRAVAVAWRDGAGNRE